MVDADGVVVVRQVADHHDHVRTQPVRDDRHHDRYADEREAAPGAAVGKVSVERAYHHRRDEIANAAAALDDRPRAGGDDEVDAGPIDRHAGRAERRHREVGGPVHERGDQRFSHRNGEQQKADRKGERLGNLQADDRHQRSLDDEHECEVLDVHRSGEHAECPQHARGGHGAEAGPERPHLVDRRAVAKPPGEPQADRHHDEPVLEDIGGGPGFHQRLRGAPVERDESRQAQTDRQEEARRRRRDAFRVRRQELAFRFHCDDPCGRAASRLAPGALNPARGRVTARGGSRSAAAAAATGR